MFDSPTLPTWKPFYVQIIRLRWMGHTYDEIALALQISAGLASKVCGSDKGQQILAQLDANTFDSLRDVQTMIQAALPGVTQKLIETALNSGNEALRTKAAGQLLAIGGHTPVHRVSFETSDPIIDQYKDMTMTDLRQSFRKLIAAKPAVIETTAQPTEDSGDESKGPD